MKTQTPVRDWTNLLLPQGAVLNDLRLLIPGAAAPLPPVIISEKQFCLKKFHYSSSLSEETNAFTADIWFKGKLAGHARNDGHGGETCIHASPGTRALLEEAEAWAKSLPPESSYATLYEGVLTLDNSSMELPQISEEVWWFSTTAINLGMLVDKEVGRRIVRQAYKGARLKKLVVCGRTPERAYPTLQQFKIEVTPELPPKLALKYAWVVPLARFLELPPHYYPAPHNYTPEWPRPRLRHKKHKVEGVVQMVGTHDHAVSLLLDNGSLWSVPLNEMHHLVAVKTPALA